MSRLWLITGGVRSGKSRLAARLAEQWAARDGRPVTVIATAEPGDAEMAARIDAHRHDRPAAWRTIEEPQDLARALGAVPTGCVVIDCLTVWASNRLLTGWPAPGPDGADPAAVIVLEGAILADLDAALSAIPASVAPVICVSNEVGSGVVAVDQQSRAYRDLLGAVNTAVARRAERVYLCVAGRALDLTGIGAVDIETLAIPEAD